MVTNSKYNKDGEDSKSCHVEQEYIMAFYVLVF